MTAGIFGWNLVFMLNRKWHTKKKNAKTIETSAKRLPFASQTKQESLPIENMNGNTESIVIQRMLIFWGFPIVWTIFRIQFSHSLTIKFPSHFCTRTVPLNGFRRNLANPSTENFVLMLRPYIIAVHFRLRFNLFQRSIVWDDQRLSTFDYWSLDLCFANQYFASHFWSICRNGRASIWHLTVHDAMNFP